MNRRLAGMLMAVRKVGMQYMSRRDLNRTGDEYVVRAKLGQSWFKRRLNPRTRRRILMDMDADERALARSKGWLQ